MSERKLTPEEHRSLIFCLRCGNELVRAQAAMRLTGAGVDEPAVRADLEGALADANPHVRRVAAWVLARLSRRKAA